MTKNKSTKRALISSTLAILMCVAMLIGTTFAWFTDTASTAVNKIQSGTLKVDLEMATAWDNDGNPTKWETADGKKLTFKTVDNRVAEKILWEPGCTYELPELRIVNNGNLALKYKVTINGVDGDAKLLKAIDFTVKKGDTKTSLEGWEGYLLPAGATPKDSDKEEVGTTEAITISGHMKEEAGNDYQNLSIDGIGVTVVATQYTYENDSFGPNYDAAATYPVANKQDLLQAIDEINNSSSDEKQVIVVTEDFTFEDETLSFKKGDVTLDLADKELTIASGNQDGILLKDGASLTLSGGTGKLNISSGSGKALHLENTADSAETTTLTIKDIQLDIQNDARTKSSIYAYAENGEKGIEINVEKGAEINVEGGRNFCAIQLANNAILNFNGGVINANGVGSVLVAGRDDAGTDAEDILLNFNDGTINITGGCVTGIECNYFATANMNGGTIRISGDCDDSYAVGASFGGYININGGTIEVKATSGKACAVATYGNYSTERKSTITIGANANIILGDSAYNELSDMYPNTVLIDQRN